MSAAALPRLRAGVRMVEQSFGGERSVVVKDAATGKYYRMPVAETLVLRAFNGTRTMADVARALAEQGIQLTEGAVERFAHHCARLGLLERSLDERTTLELERLRAERQRRRSLFRGELMRMRWSFGHPDRIIARGMPWVRWCFTRGFLIASVALFVAYFAVIALAWPEFSRAVLDVADLSQLSAGRVATYMGVTLLVILIHELGHAFTCQHFGGEVNELGFMLVYLQPAFYCNVNDAWSFPELRARLWVTAAGMWIQMVIAGAAALAWWLAAPGTWVAEVALAAMIAGGLTSVLSNANPLLPLDGYFALTDWLGIPNLRQRGLAWAGWWMRHRVFGLDVPEPAATPREAPVLRWYGTLAAVYLTTMLLLFAGVVLAVAARWAGAPGLLLALAWLSLMLARPVREWAGVARQGLRRRLARRGAWGRRALLVALSVVLVGALPWRARVRGTARAAGAHEAQVVAPAPGIVVAVLVAEGERVAAGAPLLQLADPALDAGVERLSRAVDSLTALARRARAAGAAADAALLDAAARAAQGERAALAASGGRVLRAPVAGEVATARPERLLGRRATAGLPMLALTDADSVEVRVALTGAGATRVRAGDAVRLVSLADPAATARAIVREVATIESGPGGRVEVRVHLPRGAAWRPGTRGEAQVLLGRTTIAGALLQAARERVRAEVWL